MSNHLLREHAPISARGWGLIDEEATRQLTAALAARRLVDFAGPRGWQHSAVGLGRTEPVGATPVEGVSAARRSVLPLVEARAPFAVLRAELAAADRGADDIDLDSLGAAARRLARAENIALLHGWDAAGVVGVTTASPHAPISLGDDLTACPRHVAEAVDVLRGCGIGGPYGLALGPEVHRSVVETTEHGGYPLFEHLRQILGGPLVWAPGVEGGVALSMRGGDFLLDSGQDVAIAYDGHDADQVQLCLVETFAFHVATPEAAVALTRRSER
jgi:uncharacterized linocin/CFP29 family protein